MVQYLRYSEKVIGCDDSFLVLIQLTKSFVQASNLLLADWIFQVDSSEMRRVGASSISRSTAPTTHSVSKRVAPRMPSLDHVDSMYWRPWSVE